MEDVAAKRRRIASHRLTAPGTLPSFIRPGEIIETTLDGAPVILVGSYPNGLGVVFSSRGWALLQSWKLTKISTSSGKAKVYGVGSGRHLAARFLTGTTNNAARSVEHRNGNQLDLRERNLVVVPYALKRAAKIIAKKPRKPQPSPGFITLSDGRVRAPYMQKTPNALHRFNALVLDIPLPEANWRCPKSHLSPVREGFSRPSGTVVSKPPRRSPAPTLSLENNGTTD